MKVAYIGNFSVPWSTENHVKRALELNGHDVVEVQENEPAAYARLGDGEAFILWTRTWSDAPPRAHLDRVKGSVPIVGYHLDRWWGLRRHVEITQHRAPFFAYCDLLCTADGGHDEAWKLAGIEHEWFPPAVLGQDASIKTSPMEDAPEIVFVGSHRGYHPEWSYRMKLVHRLRDTYGPRVSFWPRTDEPYEHKWRGEIVRTGQLRGQALNALYQSARVVVGDSCLAGGATRYWSDRVPETIGRGGLLVHPMVEGMTLEPHVDFAPYELGDFADLEVAIDWCLTDTDGATKMRRTGRERVLHSDTYERRMQSLIGVLHRRHLV